jgi:SM-20-related protein
VRTAAPNEGRATNATIAAPSAIARICAGIGEHGFAVEADFLPATSVRAMAAEAKQRDAAGNFRPAGIGRDAQRVERNIIRGDRIAWLDLDDPSPALQPASQALMRLRLALNATLFLGLFTFEGHYAMYPKGGVYRRHRDRFHDDDARVLSCALYLNESWSPEDGGALRLYLDANECRDILPAGGTLACFLSERFEHEVLPGTRERLALTGWFRRRTMTV